MFNDILNKYLEFYNAKTIVGIKYEQFEIAEKNDVFYIFEQGKIIGYKKTLKEAKELVNTINSGC